MAARKQMDLLTAVEQIVERAKGTGLSSEFYRKADRPTQIMGSTKPSAYLSRITQSGESPASYGGRSMWL